MNSPENVVNSEQRDRIIDHALRISSSDAAEIARKVVEEAFRNLNQKLNEVSLPDVDPAVKNAVMGLIVNEISLEVSLLQLKGKRTA